MKTQTHSQHYISSIFFSVFWLFFTVELNASTPAEMADLSLQELLAMSTDEDSGDMTNVSPWSISVLYSRLKLDGYLDGSNKLSNADVRFDNGSEARTDKNFPVVPTTITQEALIVNINYKLSSTDSVSFSVPYIRQSTDHESIVPGYAVFNIESDGLGDVSLNYSLLAESWDKQQISYSIGVSAPTGSIDQTGDTPRAPGDQQLPYTMQLGSGTWDFSAGMHYKNDEPDCTWGVNVLLKIRTGKNHRNYRLGNRFSTSIWGRWRKQAIVRPTAKLSYRHWGRIEGRDEDLIVPGNYPYPASITNPDYFGGDKINITLGSEIGSKKQFVTINIGAPVYQSLNGVQPKEVLHFNTSWNLTF